ncbi:hypothetical protein Q5752_001364 [Cryptotrichosporon argae]
MNVVAGRSSWQEMASDDVDTGAEGGSGKEYAYAALGMDDETFGVVPGAEDLFA